MNPQGKQQHETRLHTKIYFVQRLTFCTVNGRCSPVYHQVSLDTVPLADFTSIRYMSDTAHAA